MKFWSRLGSTADDIDERIAQNRAKPIVGFEKPDPEIIRRIGRQRWDATQAAQARIAEQEGA